MASLVENAIRLKNAFDAIRNAIINKGQTPSSDSIATYATAISNIDNYVKALSLSNKGSALWYGGWQYCAKSAITQYKPKNFTASSGIATRSSDELTVTIAVSGLYILFGSFSDQGYSTSSTTGNSASMIVYKNGVQTYGSSTGTYDALRYYVPSIITLNAGDQITIKFYNYAGNARSLSGALVITKIGDLT